ncbi:hypothetical protein [Neolewinella antarctica]|uniref:Uncharacterized protein n=1 Tax=Neolewinella antarctica TaxID=442734 RepID=A0ABX0XFU3_9BACT|nr:hypothetical protein [Neolewinella antarctica]NJC28194.1 hypothetical protein [Neolewinella antarctica]
MYYAFITSLVFIVTVNSLTGQSPAPQFMSMVQVTSVEDCYEDATCTQQRRKTYRPGDFHQWGFNDSTCIVTAIDHKSSYTFTKTGKDEWIEKKTSQDSVVAYTFLLRRDKIYRDILEFLGDPDGGVCGTYYAILDFYAVDTVRVK